MSFRSFVNYVKICVHTNDLDLVNSLFLKDWKDCKRIVSIIIELVPLNNNGWKKEVRQSLCLSLSKEILLCFLVTGVDNILRILAKKYEGCPFLLET